MQDGNIISHAPSVNNCWVLHFTKIFKSRAESNTNVSEAVNQLDKLYHLSRMNCDGIIDDDFTTEEIQAAKKLKPGKARGIDGLQAEHLIYGGPLITILLRQVFNNALECVPSCMLTGIIQSVYKGKGKDPLSCESYRGISITLAVMKLFEYALLERILPVLHAGEWPSPHSPESSSKEGLLPRCHLCFTRSNSQHTTWWMLCLLIPIRPREGL